MRLLRLPRLPVSRRRVDELAELVCAYNRIASEDLGEYKRRARKAERERDEARAQVSRLQRERLEREKLLDHWQHRVAELEQAIRVHQGSLANQHALDEPRNVRLRAVLDGHDRQERGDEPDGPVDFEGDSVDVDADQGGRMWRRQPESTDVGPPDNPPEPTQVCQVAEHAEAERIVGDLAKPNPGLPLGGGDGVECRYCESRWTLWERHALSLHDRECVWRRAVEHVRPHERERGDVPVTYQDGRRYTIGAYRDPLREADGDH